MLSKPSSAVRDTIKSTPADPPTDITPVATTLIDRANKKKGWDSLTKSKDPQEIQKAFPSNRSSDTEAPHKPMHLITPNKTEKKKYNSHRQIRVAESMTSWTSELPKPQVLNAIESGLIVIKRPSLAFHKGKNKQRTTP